MIDSLLNQIDDAFHDVPRPSDITRSVACALDDQWNVPEPRRAELRMKDGETRWSDLTDKDIENFADSIWFLGAEGYRFYLPAFMSYALRRYEGSDSYAIDCAIGACKYDQTKFSLFTLAQMSYVMDFLTFFANDIDDDSLATGAAAAIYYFEHPRTQPCS